MLHVITDWITVRRCVARAATVLWDRDAAWHRACAAAMVRRHLDGEPLEALARDYELPVPVVAYILGAPVDARWCARIHARSAWPGHHGSSIGVARAPERANETRNREMFQDYLDGTR